MFRSLVPALLLAAVVALAGAPPTAQAEEARYRLRVADEGWGKGGPADVSAVLRSAFDEIARHLPEPLPEGIWAKHDPTGPIVHFQRNVQGEIVMLLSARDTYWAQYAYQGAHEFCHILCGFREGESSNLWFEEALCEMASLFAVKGMAERWKTEAPYPNWRDFAKALAEYAAEVEAKYAPAPGQSLAAYYREHAAALAGNPTDREKNGRVATWLLLLFEKEPAKWQALRFLNATKGPEARTFPEYLAEWRRNCPEPLKATVAEIEALFLGESEASE